MINIAGHGALTASAGYRSLLFIILLFHSVAVLAWQRYETEIEVVVDTVIVETTTVWKYPEWSHTSTFTTLTRPSTDAQTIDTPSSVASEQPAIRPTFVPSSVTSQQISVVQQTIAPSSTFTPPAAAPSSAIDSAWSGQSFQDAVLNGTNTWRSQHDASPLIWNNTLATFAKNHSEACVWEHSGGPYGENLALNYASAGSAIDGWGNEEKDYSYSDAVFSETTGHFTQLVWKATTQVGCGAFNCPDGWYFTCEYYPPGNVPGAFTSNVVQSPDGGALSVGKRSAAVKPVASLRTRALSLAGLVGAYWVH